MDATTQMVKAARRGRRAAIVDVLAMHYRPVWRLAAGLSGRADATRGIVQYIMQRSLRAVPTWKDDGAPTRWFHRHTILLIRELLDREPTFENDTLVAGPGANDPLYVAFVRALRSLTIQQREAYLLTHGEGLDARAVAVATDCSLSATENHIRAAEECLSRLAGSEYPIMRARLVDTYRRLGPGEDMTVGAIRSQVKHLMVPWLVKRTLKAMLVLALLAGASWSAWRVWKIAQQSMGK